MGNKFHRISEEDNIVDVNISIKVKLNGFSNFKRLNDNEIIDEIDDAKYHLPIFLKNKLINKYQQEELTQGVDYWDFEVVDDNN